MDDKCSFKLKVILLERGVSQRALAFSIGIDESTISKAIRYGRASETVKERITDFLGVKKAEIFG